MQLIVWVKQNKKLDDTSLHVVLINYDPKKVP